MTKPRKKGAKGNITTKTQQKKIGVVTRSKSTVKQQTPEGSQSADLAPTFQIENKSSKTVKNKADKVLKNTGDGRKASKTDNNSHEKQTKTPG